jgi:hypothetical protein
MTSEGACNSYVRYLNAAAYYPTVATATSESSCSYKYGPSGVLQSLAIVHQCDAVSSGGGGTTTSVVTGTVTAVFPEMTTGQVADYMTVWSAFLGAAVLVVLAKALYSRFRLSKYEG